MSEDPIGGYEVWATSIDNVDEKFKEFCAELDAGNLVVDDVTDYMRNATSATSKFATTLKNVGANIGIALILNVVISKISDYAHELENARNAADTAKSTLDELNTSVSNNGKWISTNISNYEKLSDGVDSLGRNVSLTDDEFEEYNSLTNEIAEMFPTLVTGYTDTGDAILSCKNNVDLLTQAYEEQKQAAQDAVFQNAENLFNGFKADTTDWNVFSNGGMSKETERSILQDMIDGNDLSSFDWKTIATIFTNAGIETNKWIGISGDDLDKKIEENQKALYAYVRTLDTTMESATSNVTPIIDAYLDTNADFKKYDSNMQAQIKQIADNMGYRFYAQFDNQTDLVDWIDNTLVPAFNDADSQELLNELFSLNTDDMAVSDYVAQINDLIDKIAEAVGGDADEIKLKLGFDFVDTDEELLKKAKNKVDEAFGSSTPTAGSSNILDKTLESNNKKELDDWLDTLNESDLQLILDGKIEFDENTTVDSAKKALDAARKETNENPVDGKLSFNDTISQVQALSDGLDQLDKIYADVYNKKDFDWSSILNNKDFKEQFGDMTDVADEYKNAYNDFIQTISNNPSDLSACQAAFDNLATAYIYNSGVLDDLTEETKASTVAMLQQMGVANADEIVTEQLTAKKLAHKAAIDELNWANEESVASTMNSISALLQESDATDATKAALFELIAQETIFSNSSLDVSQKISALGKLATAYGLTAASAAQAESDIRLARHYGGSEEDVLNAYYDKYTKSIQDKFASISSVQYSGGSSYQSAVDKANKANKSATDSAKEIAEKYDWVKKKLEAASKATEKLGNAFDKAFGMNQTRERYQAYISQIESEIQDNTTAAQFYQDKLNQIGLSYEWISKIQSGAFSIDSVTDENLKNQISEYQTYSDKLASCFDTLESLEEKRLQASVDYAEKVIESHENEIKSIEKLIDRRKALVSLKETFNLSASKSDLAYQQKQYEKEIELLEQQNKEIYDLMWTTTYWDEAWHKYNDQLIENTSTIQDLTQSLADLASEMANLPIDKYEKALDKISAKNELFEAKLDNATSTKAKNKILNNEISLAKSKDKKAQSTAKTTQSNLNKSVKSLQTATNKDYSSTRITTSEVGPGEVARTSVKDYYKKVQKYTKSKKQIPSSLIKS